MTGPGPAGTVVEVLEFRIEPELLDRWLEIERDVWTGFLVGRPGFVHKQVWTDADDPGAVSVVIWWATREQWKRITAAQVAAVDARMGPWFRAGSLREHRVRAAWEPHPEGG